MEREKFPGVPTPEQEPPSEQADEIIEKADKELGDPLVEKIEKIGKEWPQNNGKRGNKKQPR